jgi:hypothetical protein
VFRFRAWQAACLVLLAAALVWLHAAERSWWDAVFRGVPLELECVSLPELPLELAGAHWSKRSTQGVDAQYDASSGKLFILLRWGTCPTGGYRIVLRQARLIRRFANPLVVVRADYLPPDPGQPVIEVLTYPVVAAALRLDANRAHGVTVVAVDQDGAPRGRSTPLP